MIDFTKPCQTRDGRPVRILCTDAAGRNPIVGLIQMAAGDYACQWKADGTYGDKDCNHMGHLIMMGHYKHMDLVNA